MASHLKVLEILSGKDEWKPFYEWQYLLDKEFLLSVIPDFLDWGQADFFGSSRPPTCRAGEISDSTDVGAVYH